MPLTADRDTKKRDGRQYSAKAGANAKIFAGALLARNAAGFAVPAATSTTQKALGRANAPADNTGGADGAIDVAYEKGVFLFKNSTSTDAIAAADVENDCYIVDDETVAKTNGTNTRSIAGKVKAVEAAGVWVEIS